MNTMIYSQSGASAGIGLWCLWILSCASIQRLFAMEARAARWRNEPERVALLGMLPICCVFVSMRLIEAA